MQLWSNLFHIIYACVCAPGISLLIENASYFCEGTRWPLKISECCSSARNFIFVVWLHLIQLMQWKILRFNGKFWFTCGCWSTLHLVKPLIANVTQLKVHVIDIAICMTICPQLLKKNQNSHLFDLQILKCTTFNIETQTNTGLVFDERKYITLTQIHNK